MVSSIAFAVEYKPNYNSITGDITLQINKGWNLVPISQIYSNDPDRPNTCFDNFSLDTFKAYYTYSPKLKMYLGQYQDASGVTKSVPENSVELFAEEQNSKEYYAQDYSGARWIYSTKECYYTSNILTQERWDTITQSMLDETPLRAGWNYITITPWMVGKTFKKLLALAI